MRYVKLKIGDKIHKNQNTIDDILTEKKFYWLVDSEFENADIELINNTIIWNNGNYYVGNFHYGIWKSGDFYGIWENGIFEKGNFNGIFLRISFSLFFKGKPTRSSSVSRFT